MHEGFVVFIADLLDQRLRNSFIPESEKPGKAN